MQNRSGVPCVTYSLRSESHEIGLKEDCVMTRIELPYGTSCDAASASISTLAALLHFHRTGERWKPRLAVANNTAARSRRWRPRPVLRVVTRGDSVAQVS